jgi:hypothetical protein
MLSCGVITIISKNSGERYVREFFGDKPTTLQHIPSTFMISEVKTQ